MPYQVLARKWRPQTLQDMVGQEPIRRILSNALEQHRIHHAYLFTGTRGVGKTTLARILAKCLNCETGITATPCGTCSTCQAIDAGKFLDLFEIDAASRTKVEDTRELLENVPYPPVQGRYKIYLIDEVHMLSNHSFNALLKTLEEPPQHVKFLLATTEPKRLPITILSRCLQFHLKPIPLELISDHLHYICKQEQVTADKTALNYLSKAANGSLRDAMSLLDQAIAYGQGSIKSDDIHAMLGTIAQQNLFPLMKALAAQDSNQVFHAIHLLAEHTPDFSNVLEELISLFHQIAVSQVITYQQKTDQQITELAALFKPEDVQLYYQIALLGRRDLAYTPSPQQGFEMTMLRMLALQPKQMVVQVETPTLTVAESPSWQEILPKLDLSGMAYALAANCTLEKIEDHKVILQLSANHQPMLNTKLKDRLRESLSNYFKQAMQLDIIITAAELYTPAKKQEQEQVERLTDATKAATQHPKIKQLIEMYDATIEVSLL